MPKIIAITGKHVERIELDFLIVLAGMQRIEIRDAIDAKNDGLSVDDEMLLPVLQRRFDCYCRGVVLNFFANLSLGTSDEAR